MMNCTPKTCQDLEVVPRDPQQMQRGRIPRLAEKQEPAMPAASAQPTEPSCYNPKVVRQYLEQGSHMDELYEAAFLVSSWPSGDLRSATGVRTYPARFGLLCSKWDLDMAIGQLGEFEKTVLYLYYWARHTQERVAAILDCSRARIWYTLNRLPQLLTEILNGRLIALRCAA